LKKIFNQSLALSDPGIQINAQIWRFESPLHFGNASKLVDSVAEICQKILKNSSSIGNYDNVKILNKFSDTGEEKVNFVRINIKM